MIFLFLVFFVFSSFATGLAKPQGSRSEQTDIEVVATPTTLTIQEAVEIALQNKPSLQVYKHAIEASKAQGMQVWAGYLPQVNLSTNIGESLGQGDPQTTITLSARQLVYTFAGPIENYKMAKKQTNIIELISDADKKAIKNEVEKAFLECWKVQKQQKKILALHKSSTTTINKQAHANKLELLDKNDWLKSTAEHAQNLATVDNYYQDIELAQKKLEFFMGQPIDLALTKIEKPTTRSTERKSHLLTLALEWQEPKEITSLPLITYYKYAMKNREELKVADKKVGIAKDQVYIAQRSNLPSVSLEANTGYQSRQAMPSGMYDYPPTGAANVAARNFYNFSAQVTWPIFNGLLHDYEEKAAHANMLKEMLTKDQAMQDIKLSIDNAYHTLTKALTNLKAKKVELIYAKNDLDLQKLKFKTGENSKVELDAALTAWENAEYEWLGVVTDAATQERNLAYACGYPKELFN